MPSHPPPGLPGDDGSADPVLAAAVTAYAADPARLPEVLASLHRARVLAPVVALRGETARTPEGLVQDTTAEIAVPLLVGDDAGRALLVFSDLAALARWDPAARPVPVQGSRAAQVALAEAAEALVLDVAGPATVALAHPEVRALAEGRGRTPAWQDPDLSVALAAVLDAEPTARSASLTPCEGRDARLTVVVDAGADQAGQADLAALAARLTAAVAALPAVRSGVRGLEVTVTFS